MHNYAFFDVDKTIYNGWSTMEFYIFLVKKGYGGDWVYKKDKQIGNDYQSGEIDYFEAGRQVVQVQADCVKGMTVDKVAEMKQQFMVEKNKLYAWVELLIDFFKKYDFKIYLISASASSAEAVGEYLKVDKCFTSELEIKNHTYTGKIISMLDGEEKRKAVHRIVGHLDKKAIKLGFGDSSGDIEMLESMDYAFLHEPHQKELIDIANQKGWHVVDRKNILHTVSKIIKRKL